MADGIQSKYLNNIFLVAKSNAFKQIVFLAGIAASVATGLLVYNNIQDPLYKPLDYKLTDKNSIQLTDTLEKSHIQFKINDQDGIVYVAAKDYQLAKMKLAASGIQKDDSFSFSYLNDSNSIGESQFLENARYLRALEGDLSKTIIAIDGVSAAKVHIAIPQSNSFADETGKPKASVFITVGSGLILDKEKVRSIIQIVASSVPGLDPKDVAITDQYGHYLSDALSEQSIKSAEEMNYQNNIQSYYEKRIESLISPMIGDNKINVRVHADIDFTQQEEAKEEYDPNQKAVRSEQTTTEETGASTAGGPSGSLANTPPTGQQGAQGQGQSQSNTSQGRSQSIKNYELTKSVTYKKSNAAKINSISVAVVLDNMKVIDPKTKKEVTKPVDKEMLDKVTQLVKATIGFDEKRGDIVTVINSGFNVTQIESDVKPDPFYMEAWFWELIKKIMSIVFSLIVFYVLYKRLEAYYSSMKLATQSTASSGVMDDNQLSPEMQKLKNEQINRLKEIASADPNRVALVIKNWVAEK